MLSVLGAAASVVPERPVGQQQDQENHVKVRRRVLEQSGEGPEERPGDLGEVVEVTRHTPPAGAEEQGRRSVAACVNVRGRDVLGLLTPDHDLPLSLRVLRTG